MTAFVFFIVAMGTIEAIGITWHLLNHRVPQRTAFDMAFNLAFCVGTLVWGVLILTGGAA
jgi:hypothetical protein